MREVKNTRSGKGNADNKYFDCVDISLNKQYRIFIFYINFIGINKKF